MSYPITVNEEDFELFRIARILGKRKVLELLKTILSKEIAIDDLVSFAKSGVKIEGSKLNKEALSFIMGIIREKFPEVKIPPNLNRYVPPPIKISEEKRGAKKEVAERAKGEITPQADYAHPILKALIEMGGSGRMRDVFDRVFDKMENRLKPRDFMKLSSGTAIRWKNAAQWERQKLKSEGYLKKDSPRGIWEITEKGRRLYEKLQQKMS